MAIVRRIDGGLDDNGAIALVGVVMTTQKIALEHLKRVVLLLAKFVCAASGVFEEALAAVVTIDALWVTSATCRIIRKAALNSNETLAVYVAVLRVLCRTRERATNRATCA